MGSVSRTFALYTLRVTSQRDMQIALYIWTLSLLWHIFISYMLKKAIVLPPYPSSLHHAQISLSLLWDIFITKAVLVCLP